MTKDKIKLFSIRVVPFDIGTFIDNEKKNILENTLRIFPDIDVDFLWQGISTGIILSKEISANMQLHIYNYGVGIFVIRDKDFFSPQNDFFAVDFCERRSTIHNGIYLNNHDSCDYMNRIMSHIWDALRKYTLRNTANAQWELQGRSYVMPIDFLETSEPLTQISEVDIKNRYIILNPGLVKKEDAYSKVAIIEDSKYINFENENIDNSDLYQNIKADSLLDHYKINDSISVYTSWSTLLVCYEKGKNENKIIELFTCLQVELQAFWFYTYILSMTSSNVYNYKNIMKLKDLLFDYNELTRKFFEIETSKLPTYLSDIWANMIETSYLRSHIENTKFELQFLIDKSDKKIQEKQYMYLKLNSILILSIAYIQIAPYLYKFLNGDYSNKNIYSIIAILIIYIIMIIITWKKE